MLHQFFNLAELAPTLLALVLLEHTKSPIVVVVLTIPALSAQVPLYLPRRFRVIKEEP